MPHSTAARTFLKLNSQFSALNGLTLLLAGGWAATQLLSNPAEWAPLALRGLGIGLLGLAGLLYALSRNKFVSRAAVYEIVILDVFWVVGSVILISFFGTIFTITGTLVVAIVAAAVAFFAIAQFGSAAKIEKPVAMAHVSFKGGTLSATVKRTVEAPKNVVWDIMTDHPGYADVADNISRVQVLSGDGLGMTRRCFGANGESWEETCDLFEPGQSYGFRVHTEASDYPYPFAKLSGRWSVKERAHGSEFDIEITALLKGNALSKWMFAKIAGPQFTAILIDLADAWAKRMERETRNHQLQPKQTA